MKKTALFLTIICFMSLSAPAQEGGGTIQIAIVGSSKYEDTNHIFSNLKRSSQIERLVVSLSSRGLVELSGSYHGSPDTLIEEIRGLAQDRFKVETPKVKSGKDSGAISVTLKKLSSEGAQ